MRRAPQQCRSAVFLVRVLKHASKKSKPSVEIGREGGCGAVVCETERRPDQDQTWGAVLSIPLRGTWE